jgi:hypothetical protein
VRYIDSLLSPLITRRIKNAAQTARSRKDSWMQMTPARQILQFSKCYFACRRHDGCPSPRRASAHSAGSSHISLHADLHSCNVASLAGRQCSRFGGNNGHGARASKTAKLTRNGHWPFGCASASGMPCPTQPTLASRSHPMLASLLAQRDAIIREIGAYRDSLARRVKKAVDDVIDVPAKNVEITPRLAPPAHKKSRAA